jgi:hypothetical protein
MAASSDGGSGAGFRIHRGRAIRAPIAATAVLGDGRYYCLNMQTARVRIWYLFPAFLAAGAIFQLTRTGPSARRVTVHRATHYDISRPLESLHASEAAPGGSECEPDDPR